MLQRRLPLFLVSLSTAKVDPFLVGNCKKCPQNWHVNFGGKIIINDLPENLLRADS